MKSLFIKVKMTLNILWSLRYPFKVTYISKITGRIIKSNGNI